ncbi:MAG TPA: MFS transporter [Chloroflexi bacterium]|nr:MFS transporter [Chloroflexota bacterium]
MSPFRNRDLWALTLSHFIVDFFSGAVPILLAAQTAPLELTPAQIGVLAFGYRLSSSVTQPLFGLFADRRRAPLLALAGVLWNGVFIGLAGLAGHFGVLLGLLVIAGLGSAAFHPPGGAGVPYIIAPERRGTAMSIFLLGGNSGYAFGPLAAGFIFTAFGPHGALSFTVAALLIGPLLFFLLRGLRYEGSASPPDRSARPAQPGTARLRESVPLMGVGVLALVILLRQWASESVSVYLPQYFLAQGYNLAFAGNVSFVMRIMASLGSFVAGYLADRVGRNRVIVIGLLASAPALYALLHVTDGWVFALAGVQGLLRNASLPLTLLIGQELLPDRPGMMTGLTIGFTFIMGGIGTALTGLVAEHVGLAATLNWLPLLLLLSGLAAMGLPASWRRAQSLATGGR